jgi:Tol biopolymer transport system component
VVAALVLGAATPVAPEPTAVPAKTKKCPKKRTAKKRKACKKHRKQHLQQGANPPASSQPGAPGSPGSPGSPGGPGDPGGSHTYSGHFSYEHNSFDFGQAPTWSADGSRVVDQRKVGGVWQIFTAKPDGSDSVCVTCGQPGPNMVGQYRPQGDKILFHSWRGKALTVGAPGFGGVGSEVYISNPDGSDPVRLTGVGEESEGDTTGEGEDNYHAYFSPDGSKISWTHLDCNLVTQDGKCMMEILVADYVDDAGGPRLSNIQIARPENGHYYETQLWAPDGSGFLYTESVDNSLNLELWFHNVVTGAETRLTDNAAWDEQAAFTPDMKKVIFMSSRDHPGFFNSYRNIADALGLGSETDFLTVLPMFELGFLQPVAQESTDLYELDLAGGAVTRLTTTGDDGWIIPEIMWDPHSGRLIWSEARFPEGTRAQLPIDLLRDLSELLTYVLSGNLPLPDPANPGALEIFQLERRTMVGHYE